MLNVDLTQDKVRKLLVFKLANEDRAFDVSCVREVLVPQPLHPIPQAPSFVEGVMNLREHVIAVIDLRKKLGLEITENNPGNRVVICNVESIIIGLIVDDVTEVLDVPEKEIDFTPEIVAVKGKEDVISGVARIDDRIIVVLNLNAILTKEDTDELTGFKK